MVVCVWTGAMLGAVGGGGGGGGGGSGWAGIKDDLLMKTPKMNVRRYSIGVPQK
jgi:hypothetical protein